MERATVSYHFPEVSGIGNISAFANLVAASVPDSEEVGYAGFLERSHLARSLADRFTLGGPEYSALPEQQKLEIEERIAHTAQKCAGQLNASEAAHVFIFPWVGHSYDGDFKGVTGYAPFANTVHLYVSPDRYELDAIEDTLAHEYSHAVYLREHAEEFTLLQSMVFEGMADAFQEAVTGRPAAAWSRALNEAQQVELFAELEPRLNDTDFELYQKVFFGSEKFPRWTGYAFGYAMITAYLAEFPQTSWEALMRVPAQEICTAYRRARAGSLV